MKIEYIIISKIFYLDKEKCATKCFPMNLELTPIYLKSLFNKVFLFLTVFLLFIFNQIFINYFYICISLPYFLDLFFQKILVI